MAEIRAGGHVIGEHGWELAGSAEESDLSVIDGSVADVLERVGDDPEAAAEALAAEQAQSKPRTTLVKGLESVINAEEEE